MSVGGHHPNLPRGGLLIALGIGVALALMLADPARASNSIWLSYCGAAPNGSVEGFAAVQDRGLLARGDCREAGKTAHHR